MLGLKRILIGTKAKCWKTSQRMAVVTSPHILHQSDWNSLPDSWACWELAGCSCSREKGGKNEVAWWLSKHLARVLCFYYTLLMPRGLKKLMPFGSSCEWSELPQQQSRAVSLTALKCQIMGMSWKGLCQMARKWWLQQIVIIVFFSVMDVCLYLM